MCGIAGIVTQPSDSPQESQLKIMNDLANHRGPDGSGLLVWNNAGIAHKRLAIVETTDLGSQPMHLKGMSIVFNGEIYNHVEIRIELEKLGHQFHSHSDTEVILHAWQEWGPKCLDRFNGMWAFAILDRDSNSLWLSRDRFGVKPLYYSLHENNFYFASEILQLLHFTKKRKPNLAICEDFISFGLVDHTNDTFFEGIKKLNGGSNLKIDLANMALTETQFYTLKPFNHGDIDVLLQDSVKLRLRADVAVGSCLSGGLDSSVISAIAANQLREINSESFNAVHAASSEKATNESHFANQLAEHSKIKLSTIEPHPEDYIATLGKVIKAQQEPFNSSSVIMQYFVMEKAGNLKLKVMLDGQGADEIFLGYKSYPGKVAAMLFYRGDFKNAFKLGLSTPASFLKNLMKHQQSYVDFQKLEILKNHLPALLRYEDRNSMAHSIEARLPFMDYRIIETALALKVEEKINSTWQKLILRKVAQKYIPSSIAWRTDKLGFVSPASSIMGLLKQDLVHSTARSEILKKLNKGKIIAEDQINWRHYCLAKWEAEFLS